MTDIPYPFNLAGKFIIVTGASSGIGRETAIACSKMGGVVLLTGRNTGRLEETFQLMQYSGHHMMFPMDLTDSSKVDVLVRELKSKQINVHGLVHSAGISTTLPFKMTSAEKMEEYFRVNTIAGFSLCREMLRNGLPHRSGMSIVFIASIMGMSGTKGRTLYGMTKGAILSGTKSMALELAPKNIRVNTVSPGVVETPLSEKSVYRQDKALLERVVSHHPLGLGRPSDVANACLYLLSDAARWITGTNLVVDGGYMAGKQ